MNTKPRQYIIGFLSGFANGLFGSGGGSVFVPLAEKYLGLETKKAHATAVAVILPLCVVSLIAGMRAAEFDVTAAIFLSVGGAAGGLFGSKLLSKLRNGAIHKIFGLCMIIAAMKMIF
jgi:uncharacterized membrane protein YfcA